MFRPPSFAERAFRSENPNVYARERRRFRWEPVALLLFGLVLPFLMGPISGEERPTFADALAVWGLLTVLGCLIATFAESDRERALRYTRWLGRFEAELEEARSSDERRREAITSQKGEGK